MEYNIEYNKDERSKHGWYNFTYLLFYPGILGSMLYDLFPIKGLFIAKFSIVVLYCIDYFHLYNDLNCLADNNSPHRYHLDFFIALLFYGAYQFVKADTPYIRLAFLCLLIIFFLVDFYYVFIPKSKKTQSIIPILLSFFSVLGMCIGTESFLNTVSPLMFVAYFLHVKWFFKSKQKIYREVATYGNKNS